jgi:putative PIN family toxin of toxin-antitoxin system
LIVGDVHPPLRLVLDTNVVIAGLLWNGPPRRLLEAALAGDVELLDELTRTLGDAKFDKRVAGFGVVTQALVAQYIALVRVVAPGRVPRVVVNDADHDHVIAAAVAGQADPIASGDQRDLLPMGSFQGIPIVTAREAIERLVARLKTQPKACHRAAVRRRPRASEARPMDREASISEEGSGTAL